MNIVKITALLLILSYQLVAKQIACKVDDQPFKTANAVHLQPTQKLQLKFDVPNSKSIKWYQIIPDTSKFYKNANHPWESNPYKWVGFGTIDYKRVEIEPFRDQKVVEINAKIKALHKPSGNPFYNTELGSFWFEAVATLPNGKTVKSPGLEKNNYLGLSIKVFRATYQESDDYIGYLTGFFNVPGIFGAVPKQSRGYIGVDCADVLMATSAIINDIKLKEYNVAMLVSKLKHLATFELKKGVPSKQLKWGEDFRRGDFIAVKYHANGRYAHIGLLYQDANNNGVLDRDDIVINAGPNALHTKRLCDGGFDGFIKILGNEDL